MNQKDKDLLNLLQFEFPLCEKPYQKIGQKLNLSEEQVINRIKHLKTQGIIRRIGGVFEAKKVKHISALVAAKVPKNKTNKTASVLQAFREVTHGYTRSHSYNLWFTLTTTSNQKMKQLAEKIKNSAGITDLHILPALSKFKIDTRFKL